MSSTPIDQVLAESWEGTIDSLNVFVRTVLEVIHDDVVTAVEKGHIAVRAMEVLEASDGHQVTVNRTAATISIGRTLAHAGADSDWLFRKLTEFRRDMAGTVQDSSRANEKSPDPRQRIEALATP